MHSPTGSQKNRASREAAARSRPAIRSAWCRWPPRSSNRRSSAASNWSTRLAFVRGSRSHVLDRDDILAGSDRQRAEELQAFFADPDIRAIFVARGGYGSGRILPLLDFEAIALTPKPFVGFSDLTFLLNPIVERARMVAFHGPMLAIDHAN